jgi:hypothetical protein
MRSRVERHVRAHLVGERLEPVDAEIGAEDPLQGRAADARARDPRELFERSAADTWGPASARGECG